MKQRNAELDFNFYFFHFTFVSCDYRSVLLAQFKTPGETAVRAFALIWPGPFAKIGRIRRATAERFSFFPMERRFSRRGCVEWA